MSLHVNRLYFNWMTMISRRQLLLSASTIPGAVLASTAPPSAAHLPSPASSLDGLCWQGSSHSRALFEHFLRKWLTENSIREDLLTITSHPFHTQALLTLFHGEVGTLDLHHRPRLWLGHDVLDKPIPRTLETPIPTTVVSIKEIFLAFISPGRATMLCPEHAQFSTFLTHMEQRQSTALWAQRIGWDWPDGEKAGWNKKYWNRGTPWTKESTYHAYLDAHVHPEKYAIGCYTAAKLAMGMGLLDYAYRLKPDHTLQRRTLDALWLNNDPLVGVEPSDVWYFEPGYDSAALVRPGTTHTYQNATHPRHMIPGDWVYFFNTDPITYDKTGYEGSNAIYLGHGRFSDYYNDHGFSYGFEEKLDDVYQWRNGVFSRSRHFEKSQILSSYQLSQLEKTPEQGGVLLPWRVFPKMELARGI